MKISDDQLNRFFRQASRAPETNAAGLSPQLRWRIMADWRRSRQEPGGAGVARVFQFGFSFAFAVMILIAVFGVRQINQERADEYTSPNALINVTLAE